MEDIDVSESLLVVRLNCGEPVSVSSSHPALQNISVVFIESGVMAEDLEDPITLSDDEIVAGTSSVQYDEDLGELVDQLEDLGVI